MNDTMPTSAIIGDAQGIDLPEAKPSEQDLTLEKNIAKFSKTREWQNLKEHLEARIEFYRHFLPDGREIGLQKTPSPEDWMVANRVIGEFRAVIDAYENIRKVVDDAPRP